jgi:hypothetical protein
MRLIIGIVLLVATSALHAQCVSVYKRERVADYIYPGVDIYHITQMGRDSIGLYINIQDQKNTDPYYTTISPSKGRHLLHIRNEQNGFSHCWIETAFANDSISGNMGRGKLMGNIITPQGCVTYFYNNNRKHNSITSTYLTELNEIIVRDIPLSYIIGKNDTSLFLSTTKFKDNKTKYAAGTIISIGVNSNDIREPLYKKQPNTFSDCVFYADPYIIRHEEGTHYQNNCSSAIQYTLFIYHNKTLSDSITYLRKWGNEFYTLHQDTLTFVYVKQDSSLQFASLGIYQFVEGKAISHWDEADWPDLFVPNGSPVAKYLIKNNVLFIQVDDWFNPDQLMRNSANTPVTQNSLPINRAGTAPIVMAFDLQQNTFLGYPKISIVD